MKRLFLAFAIIASMVSFCSCNSNGSSCESDTTTFVDDYGESVFVPTHPQRIVSVSPAVTQIIFDLGAQDLLVGRTEYCTHPAEALQIENIGGISNLNIEKVLSLNPDLVISGSMVPKSSADQIRNMGVPFVSVIEKEHFSNLYDNITRIGVLTNRQEQAQHLCDSIQKQIANLTPIDTANRPTVYYVIGYGKGGNFTAGGNTFIDEIISMAGGSNIAHDIEGWSYSLEALMSADPDWIIVRKEDYQGFSTTAPYTKLTAVKNGNLVVLEESSMLDLQVPQNIEAIKLLNKKFCNHK